METKSLRLRSLLSAGTSVLPLLAALSLAAPIATAEIAFDDVTATANVGRSGESFGAAWGDLNGDGYLEIFASNHRMQPSLFLNRGNGRFVNVATQVKPWVFRPTADTHGGSWFDFDNDGDQDLVVGLGTGNLPHFLVNEYGRLVDRTVEAGLTENLKGNRLPVWLDYDGDRLPDLVMANHGGIARLFRQDRPGHFTDETVDANFVCLRTHYGHLFELYGDGRLEYMCPKIERFPLRIYDTRPFPWAKIFDNENPNSLFPIVPSVVDSTVADFDNDQRMDMFLLSNSQLETSSVVQAGSTHFEAQLVGGNKGFRFVTSGNVTFTPDWNRADEGTELHLSRYKIGAGGRSPSALPFTLDPADPSVAGLPPAPTTVDQLPMMRIGYEPLYRRWTLVLHTQISAGVYYFSEAYVSVDSTQAITNLVGTGLWNTDKPGRPTLLMNETGGFVDRTVTGGLDAPIQCGSVAAGDFDNDMDIDLYLACRTGASNIPNVLYENLGNGTGTFRAVSGAGGAAGPVGIAAAGGAGTADSAIAGDYDVDGFLDLFVTNGLNLRPRATGGPNKLFRNRGNGNNWIELELVGTQSERDAVGARVYATANQVQQLRVQNGAYHRWSQDSRRSHFGLAGASTVDLRVVWPNGIAQTFNDVPANRLYRITQGSSVAVPVPLGNALAYQCGPPTLNGAVDVGVFIWRDCPSGEWRMKAVSGGGSVSYAGTVVSDRAYSKVTPMALETNDVLNWTSNPSVISFNFVSTGSGFDGVNFLPQDRASNCFRITAPTGVRVYYGPFRTLMPQPFNLDTQQSCGG